jgi:hypothetical protein
MAQGQTISFVEVEAEDLALGSNETADWIASRVASAAAKTSIAPSLAASVASLTRARLSEGPVSAGELGKIATELLSFIEQDAENAAK